MNPKLKNLIIFLAIGLILILLYVFFIKDDSAEEELLTSSAPLTTMPEAGTYSRESELENSLIAENFLSLLLGVRGITLDDSILSDPAFASLKDSSIVLIPTGDEGRPNPFAPIGSGL